MIMILKVLRRPKGDYYAIANYLYGNWHLLSAWCYATEDEARAAMPLYIRQEIRIREILHE